MEPFIKKLAQYSIIKSLTILLYSWYIYSNSLGYDFNFLYIITLEVVVFGIYFTAINSDNKRMNFLDSLPILISFLQIIGFVLLLVFLNNYRNLYINGVMIKCWVVFQLIYLALISVPFYNKTKGLRFASFGLLTGAFIICLVTVLNNKYGGGNSHIYRPLIWFGVFYFLSALMLKRMPANEVSDKLKGNKTSDSSVTR